MGSIGEEIPRVGSLQMAQNHEEKILVLVRLRPLSEKEILSNEATDWECINDTTILYRNTLREGSTYPSAYSFDRVFRGDCSTRKVYDDGVKDVALSVVRGINASVFAYGQTSSGKTYTMMGVTEFAVADIFEYIRQHQERAFVLKFSAIEIYNEAIRDLLSVDSSPLRLLDDQEKGTVIEKVREETLKDWNHLRELLSVCEAQRRIGETSLNEKSSRSHQILRLTIESSAREFLSRESSASLSSTVNFVDLAGSERASQASSSGARLKEGCHINRSLLTLGTVIRKLSMGRSGHVNYRDSKLTRLLQPALGGNARTAIICTVSPARSHVEQTRNTLLFACCAKEVTTKAQVNVVMSDKALVKHLQREVARLESELRAPAPQPSSSSINDLLKKKDLQIQSMEKQIRDLTRQRDLAESRVQDLLRIVGNDQISSRLADSSRTWEGDYSVSESSCCNRTGDDSYISNGYCKEVQCIEIENQLDPPPEERLPANATNFEYADTQEDRDDGFAYHVLEQRLHHVESALDDLIAPHIDNPSSESSAIHSSNARNWSCRQNLLATMESAISSKASPLFHDAADNARLSRNFSQSSLGSMKAASTDEVLEIPSVQSFVSEIKDMANQVMIVRDERSSSDWNTEFESKQKAIIQLWKNCNVSLVHRTYFFLLFKGDVSDSIYMEVEHKRLTFLQEQPLTIASSAKALSRERVMLSKLMRKRLSEEERRVLYSQWGIGLNSRRRRVQLANRLWSSAEDGDHIRESAAIVAKLVRFVEQGKALQGMFGLSFAPLSGSSRRRSSLGWSHSSASFL